MREEGRGQLSRNRCRMTPALLPHGEGVQVTRWGISGDDRQVASITSRGQGVNIITGWPIMRLCINTQCVWGPPSVTLNTNCAQTVSNLICFLWEATKSVFVVWNIIPLIWIVSFRVFTGEGSGETPSVMKTAATSMTLNCADLMFTNTFQNL